MDDHKLNLKDIAIIDALPVYNTDNLILEVGCGQGGIDFRLMEMGYKVYATDYKRHDTWEDIENEKGFIKFFEANIYDLKSFHDIKAPVVICSEVLEHLTDYKIALKNLLKLAQVRLIITIPHEESFGGRFAPPPEGHCNFWSDTRKFWKYKKVSEFHKLCHPFSVAISKIRTKAKDVQMKQYCYLIVVDMTQNLIYD